MKKVIIGIFIGILVSGAVYAATIASSKVSYDNKTSKSSSTNVQGAIDELYSDAVAGKTKIAQAITNKGINTLSTDSYDTIAQNINNISVGNSNLRYDEENNSIDVIDKDGNWVSIYKTSSVPIDGWNGYIYNNGLIDKRFSDYTFSSTSTITFYDDYIFFHPVGKESSPAYATVTFYNVDLTSYKYVNLYGSVSGAGWIGVDILIDEEAVLHLKYSGVDVFGRSFESIEKYTGKHTVTIKVSQNGQSRTAKIKQLYFTTE